VINGLAAEELELVFERLGQGLVRIGRDYSVVSANQAAKRQFLPARLRLGEPLPEAWPDVSLREVARRLIDRHEVSPRAQRIPTVVRDAHGADGRTFRITGFPVRADGPALLHIEDRSTVDRRSRAEREFVANAAHELLTPLTGIITAAFALEAGAKKVPEERDRFISHIASHADRLTRISRSLLVVARAQSGQEPPRLESVPLKPLLEDVLAATAPDHESDVSLHCAAHLEVFVDRDVAEQAFSNLVTNAARHARGASISVSADEIDTREVGVDVVDMGAGIAAEGLEHVGDRFYTSGGRDSGGFGLGVSIAAQAIEILGGTLTYASAPGEGTRARVRLRSGRLAAI
jgi:signal transduction histidine kinase